MLKTASLSDKGIKRKMNQDVVYTSDLPVGNLPNLYMICDGMGGHKAGDYASRYAVETIVNLAENSHERNAEKILQAGIDKATKEIFDMANNNENMEGMGTTLVAAVVYKDTMKVANIGDSRLYLIRGKSIKQITVDHSLVEEMVRLGEIDRDSARNHPNKNIITRAVGVGDEVEADFYDVPIQKGDTILLCSDGLSNMLEDEEIRMVSSAQRDLLEKTDALVRIANQNGGKDNISVVMIEVE